MSVPGSEDHDPDQGRFHLVTDDDANLTEKSAELKFRLGANTVKVESLTVRSELADLFGFMMALYAEDAKLTAEEEGYIEGSHSID